MNKKKFTIIGMVIAVLTVSIAGYALVSGQSEKPVSPGSATATADEDFDLGITYLTVTPGIVAHYNLGVDSGALVTAVTHGSLADHLGIHVGDVIVSFNGTAPGHEAPLLGMMRSCHAGHPMVIEVWTGDTNRTLEFAHVVE